jgi:hypothetical protein
VNSAHHRRREPGADAASAFGLTIATFGPLALAALCIPIREGTATANLALLFVIVVVAAAATGGRLAGTIAAVISTMAYDFFLTRPYGSLKIGRAADFQTAGLLLLIGLITSKLMSFAYGYRVASTRSRDEIQRLHKITDLVAAGVDVKWIVAVVRDELVGLLALRDCAFEVAPFDVSLPRIQHDGTFVTRRRRLSRGEFALPDSGAELQVEARGITFGRFILVPRPEVGASLEARTVAVMLVEQLATAFAAEHEHATASFERGHVEH